MVRTCKNHHTANSSNKTLTESNINNVDQSQQLDITSNINTNESQPSNTLRTSTLDKQVIITNSLETSSPKSDVKKQPGHKNTTTIPTEPIAQTDTLSYKMDQLTAQEEPHPSDMNAKKQQKKKKTTATPTKHTPQPTQEQSITLDTNAKKQRENKNTSTIPTELAAQTESSSTKGNFYFIMFFFTLSRVFM